MVIERKTERDTGFEEYKIRQGRKINSKRERFVDSIPRRRKKFLQLFKIQKFIQVFPPGQTLCLGARTGCEVWALRQLKHDAIGIDLHPAQPDDGLVLEGDWHHIEFPDNKFDNVFTNSIDHCYDLSLMSAEVHRVLKPNGIFVVAIADWQKLSTKSDKAEYMLSSQNYLFWKSGKDLAKSIISFGFDLDGIFKFRSSWEFLVFKNKR